MSVISFEEQRKRLEKRGSKAKSQSKLSTPQDGHGQILTDDAGDKFSHEELMLFMTVLEIADRAPSVKSRFARQMGLYVAIAASIGLITVRIDEERFANNWMITDMGEEWIRSV